MYKFKREVVTSTSERRSGFDTADDEFETDDDRGLRAHGQRLGSRSKDFRSTDEDADIDDWHESDTFARFHSTNTMTSNASGRSRTGQSTLDPKSKCTCCPYGYHVDLDFLRELNADEYQNVVSDPRYLVEHHKRLHRMQQEQFRQRAAAATTTTTNTSSSLAAGQQAFHQQQQLQQQQQQHRQQQQLLQQTQQQQHQQQQKHYQHQSHQQQHQYHLQQQQHQQQSTLRSKSPHSTTTLHSVREPTYENALAVYNADGRSSANALSSTFTRTTLGGHQSRHSSNGYLPGVATTNGYEPDSSNRRENVTVAEDGSTVTRLIEEVHRTKTTIIDYDSEDEDVRVDEGEPAQRRPRDRASRRPDSSPEPASPGYARDVVDGSPVGEKLLPRQQHLVELQKKLRQIQPVDQRGPLRTYVNAADPRPVLEEDREEPDRLHKGWIPTSRPNVDEMDDPVLTGPVSKPHRDPDPEWLREKDDLLRKIKKLEEDRVQEKREREDYERKIRDLESENRRNMDDYKSRLTLLDRQLKAKDKPTRDAGVGDQKVDEVDDTQATIRQFHGVTGQLPQQPVRVHEKELNTEETTEIREREIKTIFVSGIDDKFSLAVANQPSVQRDAPRRAETKSIGVGDGSVFDDSQSRLEVHEKELRTVYIGGPEGGKVPTRNVGILCKTAMRDVGMVHNTEDEKPILKNASVGAGEIGVSESDISTFSTQMDAAGERAVVVNQNAVARAPGDEGGEESYFASSGFCHTTLTNIKGGGGLAGLQGDKLKAYLDGVLKRTVHSVGTQCQFSTENKGTDAGRVGYDVANVGVSDDTVDVEVRPLRVTKSVAIDHRPSLFHRCVGTEIIFKLDVGTNTKPQETFSSRSTNTDPKPVLPAATMTDSTKLQSVQTGTELPIFFAMDQFRTTGVMTDDVDMYNKRVNTETEAETRERIGTSVTSGSRVEATATETSETRKEIVRGEEQATGYRRYVEETVTPGYIISHTRTSRSRTHRDGSSPRRSSSGRDEGTAGYTTTTVVHTRDKSPRRVTFDSSSAVTSATRSATSSDSTAGLLLYGVDAVSKKTKTSETDGVSRVVTESEGPGYRETVVKESYSSTTGGGKSVGIPLVPGAAGFPKEFFSEDGSVSSTFLTTSVSGSDAPAVPERTSRARVVGGSSTSSTSTITRTEIDEKTGAKRYISETRAPGFAETTVKSSYTSAVDGISGGGGGGMFGIEFKADPSSGTVLGHTVKGPYYTEKSITTGVEGLTSAILDVEFKAGESSSVVQSSREGGHYVTEVQRQSHRTSPQVLVNEPIPILIDESGVGMGGISGGSHAVKSITEKRTYSTSGSSEASLTGGLGHGVKTVIRESYGPNNIKTVTTEKVDMKTGQVISSSTTQTHYDHLPKFDESATSMATTSMSSSSSSSSSRATFDFARSAMTSERFVPDGELGGACSNYALWIKDNSKFTQAQLTEFESVVYNRWLHAAGGAASNAHLVRSFMAYLNELSPELLKRVVNSTDENGNTALHFALSHSRMDIVQVILDAKVIDANKANAVGNTPVLISALAVEPNKYNLDVLRKLYSIGDVNARAFGSEQTALMLATGRGRTEIVELLLSDCCQCDINAKDSDGFTALIHAAQKGHTDIVKLLLGTSKCDVSIKNKEGKTALEVAKQVGHEFIVSQLESHAKGLQKK